MNSKAKKHLGRAKDFLARGNEFYVKAADEVIAAKDADPGLTHNDIGDFLGYGRAWSTQLISWRKKGAAAPPTPFAEPHRETPDVRGARRVLAQAPVEEIKELLDDLPDEVVTKVAEATEGTRITRALYPDQPKPTFKKAKQRAAAKDAAILKANPWEANARLGSTIGSARAAIRAVVQQYQEFLALVDDEEYREDGREQLVTLRADVDISLGEVLEGSIDQALSRLLNEEVK